MIELPSGVHVIRGRKGKSYYYWHPHRGTPRAGKRTLIGTDPKDPEFWQKLKTLSGATNEIKSGTFAALIQAYKASRAFTSRRERTQEHYEHQLGRIKAAWGDLPVSGLTVKGIYKLRAEYEETPVAANHLVSVLRTILKWGLQHGYGERNPAREIEPIKIEDEESAKPWPEEAYQYVLKHAPEEIRRAVFLGRATGQRRSDLVRLGKRHRDRDGLSFTISKRRDKPHFIPLTKAQIETLDSWACSDLGPWIISPTGRAMSGDALQSSLNRFLAKEPHKTALKGHVLKMHGLRALAACDRKIQGMENRAIGANIGMSAGMVERYIRHIDKERLARGVRDGLERAGN